jgi:hypothetical protein
MMMRFFIAVLAVALLAMPAYAQMAAGAGKPSDRTPPPPPVDEAQKKKDEKAFKEGVSRIPTPEKKYDPWGVVRDGNNR